MSNVLHTTASVVVSTMTNSYRTPRVSGVQMGNMSQTSSGPKTCLAVPNGELDDPVSQMCWWRRAACEQADASPQCPQGFWGIYRLKPLSFSYW